MLGVLLPILALCFFINAQLWAILRVLDITNKSGIDSNILIIIFYNL